MIAHRGPDDEGVYSNDALSLGHKRLSIIDLKTGQQPLIAGNGRYVIVFNGEIYNYRELRRRLEAKGCTFVSQSDTEVLLLWVAEYGISGLADLNGMFAFALWDNSTGKLLLARDRLGIKPLYYGQFGGRLAFASEIKALLPWMEKRRANYNAIFEFLTFQNVLGNETFFEGVFKLDPGEWMEWDQGGIKKGRYWDISFPRDYSGNFDDTLGEFQDTLKRSVQRQLVSDVPVGSYLSGGIDSSSVATLAAKEMSGPFHTFTGAFTDSAYYDERSGSRSVSSMIGSENHEVEISPQDYADSIGKVIWHLDEPTLGTGALPQFIVSQMVSKHVKVVMTGHGGDELFAGYQVNKALLIRETIKNNPLALPGVLFGMRPGEWTRSLYFLLFPLLYPEVKHGLFIMTPKRNRARLLSKDFLAKVSGYDPLSQISSLVGGKGFSPSEKLLYLYLKTYLPTLFIQEDKVGMAHSIEARIPLCDNEIIDLALKIPFELKTAAGLKSIPREAMRPFLPKTLYDLPKRGFPTPFANWYRSDPVKPILDDLLFSQRARERGIFNPDNVRQVYNRNMSSSNDNLADYARANKLYSMSMVELWFRTFIDGGAPVSWQS